MAEKGKKQKNKGTTRGVNVCVVQKSKTPKKTRNSSKKSVKAKKPAVQLPKETGFDEFETLKITRAEKPHESKIITRDVAKESPLPKALPKDIHKITEKPTPKKSTTKKMAGIQPIPTKPTAKEIKEQEIQKVLTSASRLPEPKKKRSRFAFANFSWPRVILATACLTTAVFAIVYFVNLTSTDMSIKVAAMQSGIEAKYPTYVPRGYDLSDVTSANGKVTMHFKKDDDSFTLIEEDSNWDSNALLNNYIKENYGEDYTVVREQGLTLYMGDDWCIWVNGKMLYKIFVNSGELTKKQMKTIAVSL